jgi:hypothetical protein
MGVDGNGKVVDPITKGLNGHAVTPKLQGTTAKKITLGSLFSISAR